MAPVSFLPMMTLPPMATTTRLCASCATALPKARPPSRFVDYIPARAPGQQLVKKRGVSNRMLKKSIHGFFSYDLAEWDSPMSHKLLNFLFSQSGNPSMDRLSGCVFPQPAKGRRTARKNGWIKGGG